MSAITSAVEALAQVPLFARVSEEVLTALAERTEDRTFAVGRVVAEQGNPNDGLLVIVKGGDLVARLRETLDWLDEADQSAQ